MTPQDAPERERLTVVPITQRETSAFVREHHRHHDAARGSVFCLAVAAAGEVVGVATVGRPVARLYDDGWTLEVNRSCTSPSAPHGTNSLLYARAWKVAKQLGWRRLITYTQEGETGASLRGAGWRIVAERPPHAGWDRPGRPRVPTGTERVHRTLWEAS